MKVGVVGMGVVGSAVHEGLAKLGREMYHHDIKMGTSIEDVLATDLCFICVPTPSMDNGDCNVSIVESVVKDLLEQHYGGVICIKSTVPPGTTDRLKEEHACENICFVPEFLRERCALDDFINNHDLCIIGTRSPEIYELVKRCHGGYPDEFKLLSESEAEMCKYFNNVYNATLITFANSVYEICEKMDVDYGKVKSTMVVRRHINDVYLDCNESLRGFGGVCLPKDTKTLNALCGKLNLDVGFFECLIQENNKYKITVFDGMRKE
tara:strand:- start:2341 stop:3138 length:798 start_codon:yes stop_codon:yes gene_type:complete